MLATREYGDRVRTVTSDLRRFDVPRKHSLSWFLSAATYWLAFFTVALWYARLGTPPLEAALSLQSFESARDSRQLTKILNSGFAIIAMLIHIASMAGGSRRWRHVVAGTRAWLSLLAGALGFPLWRVLSGAVAAWGSPLMQLILVAIATALLTGALCELAHRYAASRERESVT